jgi:hypothetical protein
MQKIFHDIEIHNTNYHHNRKAESGAIVGVVVFCIGLFIIIISCTYESIYCMHIKTESRSNSETYTASKLKTSHTCNRYNIYDATPTTAAVSITEKYDHCTYVFVHVHTQTLQTVFDKKIDFL